MLVLLLSLMLPTLILAQDNQQAPGPNDPPVTEWIKAPEIGDITKNIHFIVDFSGSMHPEQIAQAIQQTIDIATKNVDELNIKVTVFANNVETWPGIENDKMPGWTAMPSDDARKNLSEWFTNVNINNGSTYLNLGLQRVAETLVEDETVIIISDMMFDDNPHVILFNIKTLNGHGVHFGFIGMNATEQYVNILKNVFLSETNAFFCNITFYMAPSDEPDNTLGPPAPPPPPPDPH